MRVLNKRGRGVYELKIKEERAVRVGSRVSGVIGLEMKNIGGERNRIGVRK